MIWYLRRQDPLDDVGNPRGRAGAGVRFFKRDISSGEAFVKDPLDLGGGEAALLAYDLHCGAEAIMPRHRLRSGWS